MNLETVGSVCSGIEAASVAWKSLNLRFQWFSEIADFPSKVLKERYPDIPNLGDMNNIPLLLSNGKIECPDIICGGTPCQAFSLAGLQNGLNDERGNLTLKFVDIVNENDRQRQKKGLEPSIVFWENVEGVLSDKTNAFGCFISSLAGFSNIIEKKKWSNSGLVYGPKRNIAWRILDAKYFGVPQQRKRLYLIAGGKSFHPENVLFEEHTTEFSEFPNSKLSFHKDGHRFEVFREYTDCLYSAYGTKWNGNAAAYNGSLFIVQDDRIRRLSPLECERLMGFPDNYTNLNCAKRTNQYQAIGNSWAVPVINWIGNRLINYNTHIEEIFKCSQYKSMFSVQIKDEGVYFALGKGLICLDENIILNVTDCPENSVYSSLKDIISPNAPESIYISPVGCYGIIRRKNERNIKINSRLEEILLYISSQMSYYDIEKKSRIQHRGRYSVSENSEIPTDNIVQLSFFDTI